MNRFRPQLTYANVVSTLCLFILLGGGAYAAIKLPKNSVGTKQIHKGAVTGKKIGKNAVTSPKVKDSSLLAQDFAPGQLPAGPQGLKGDQGPPGPTFGATAMGSTFEAAADPVASPDDTSMDATDHGRHFEFTLPAGGNAYIRFFTPIWGITCTAGTAEFGLYLDGAPVPESAHALPPQASGQSRESVVVIPISAGAHTLEARYDCPGGTLTGANENNVPDWTVLLLGS